MASNQTNLVENLKQLITQLITNLITATLQVLETSGDVTNSFNALAEIAENDPRFTQFEPQLLQILEENGIETEAWINASNAARSQSSSDTEIQESMDTLQQQVEEIFTDARIQELAEELRIYYDGILNHESLTDIFNGPLQIVSYLGLRPFVALLFATEFGLKEALEEFLTKFLEVEAALNDQDN